MSGRRKNKSAHCGQKIPYKDKKTAELEELAIRIRTGSQRRMRAYRCGVCAQWHLGHDNH